MQFDDSINNNTEVVKELIAVCSREQRQRAQKAAMMVESLVMALGKEYPKDPMISLGLTFAMLKILKLMMEAEKKAEESGRGLIQLLN